MAPLAFPTTAAAHEFVATVTLAEGGSALIDGAKACAPASGMRLRHADILQTGSKAFVVGRQQT